MQVELRLCELPYSLRQCGLSLSVRGLPFSAAFLAHALVLDRLACLFILLLILAIATNPTIMMVLRKTTSNSKTNAQPDGKLMDVVADDGTGEGRTDCVRGGVVAVVVVIMAVGWT